MMGLSPTLFLATAIFVLQSYHPSLSLADAVATSDESNFNLRHHHQEVVDVDVGVDNDDDEPCDESFPLAPSQENHHHHQQHQNNHHERRRMVVLPSDPTRRTSAPLCTDPNDPHKILRINIHSRHLTTCTAGMCFVPAYQGCFHTTSYECNNANIIPLPAPLPTPAPAFPIVETVHPVKLVLMGVPSGYTRLSAEVKSLILRYVSEMLGESLRKVGLQFIKVDYAGRFKNGNYHNDNDNDNGNNNNNDDSSSNNGGNGIKGPRPDSGKTEGKVRIRHLRAVSRYTNNNNMQQQQKQRRLDSIAVPLAITVKGPADISNFALAYIMEILRERFGDLILYLQENGEILNADGTVSVNGSGNGNGDGGKYVFEDLELSAEEYDFADVLTGSTNPPTDMPTRRPTGRPTTPSPVDNQEDEKEEMVIKVVDDTSSSSSSANSNTNTNSDTGIVIKEETSSIPWWVWLIIILIIVILCICCVCGCLRRQRNNNRTKENKNNDNQQSVNIWMTNARATSFRNKSRGTNGDPRNKSREMNNNNKRSQQRGAPPKRVPNHNERRDGYDYSHNNETRRTSRPRIPRQISQTELEEETRAWEYGDREEYNNNEGRRRSRGPPSRPRIPRQVSQTELDEEARAKEYEGDDVLADMVFGENNTAIVPVDTAVSLDPPEENAMVSYSSHHRHRHLDGSNRSESSSEEPQGVKVSKKASRYASQVYCGKPASRSRKNSSRDEMSHRSEEPEGAKIPKKGSMFAADAMVLYNSSSPDPVESDYERQQQQQRKEPRGRRTPKKDSMFTCPMEDLPEEYRSKALRSGAAESRAVGKSSRRDDPDGRRRKRKSKKSKRSATDKLRSSLTRSLTRSRHRSTEDDSPQDIVIDHDDSVSDSPSMMTMPIELRKDDEPEEDLEGSSEQQSDIDESERSRYERADDGRKKSKKKKKKKKERSSRAPEHSNAGGSGSRRTGRDTNGSMSSEDESVVDSPSMMNTFQRIEER